MDLKDERAAFFLMIPVQLGVAPNFETND